METLNELLCSLVEGPKLLHFWNPQDEIESHSYKSIFEGAETVALFLLSHGLEKGEKVAILLPTHPDFLKAFFGVLLAGLVPSALYPPLRLGKLDEWKRSTAVMLETLSARIVLTDKRIFPFLGSPVALAKPSHGCQTIESILSSSPSRRMGILPKVTKDDLAFIQFSSGSTGKPKAVAITHFNALSNAQLIIDRFDLPEGSESRRTVSWLPLYHDMGLVGALITSMLARAPLLLLRPEEFLARPFIWPLAITRFKAGVSVAPNFAFALCARKVREEELKELDLSSWKVALCGAETIHPETFVRFISKFSQVHFSPEILTPVYGLAEATLAVTFSDKDKSPEFVTFSPELLQEQGVAQELKGGLALANLGTPLKGITLEIRDEKNRPLPENHIGRIWVKGPSVMKEYFNDPKETAAVLRKGFLDTGDRGFIYGGNLFLYGRYKEILIHRGRNYDPSLFERAISHFPELREGSVVAAAHSDPSLDTESIVILAETRLKPFKGNSLAEEELVKRIKATVLIETQLLVTDVVLLPPGTLPKTSSGKLRRREALDLWLRKKLMKPKKISASYIIREMLKGYWEFWRLKVKRS